MNKIIGTLVFEAITGVYADAGMTQVVVAIPAITYPDAQCTKPDLGLIKSPQLGDVTDAESNARVRAYNFHVKEFNRTSEAYRACIHRYVDNANRELRRIQDQANVDLKRITENSNAAMDEIQGKVKQAISDLNDLVRAEESAAAVPPERH